MWIQEKAGENTVKKRSLVEIAREREMKNLNKVKAKEVIRGYIVRKKRELNQHEGWK